MTWIPQEHYGSYQFHEEYQVFPSDLFYPTACNVYDSEHLDRLLGYMRVYGWDDTIPPAWGDLTTITETDLEEQAAYGDTPYNRMLTLQDVGRVIPAIQGGNHRVAAAEQLGIPIRFHVTD